MKKRCYKCGRKRLLKFFSKNPSKKDGHSTACKFCMREYSSNHYQQNKRYYAQKAKVREKELSEWVDSLKTGPCKDCGKKFHPWQMDFDHVKTGKLFNVSSAAKLRISRARILEEIKKCELVCSNCHRDRTHKRASVTQRKSAGFRNRASGVRIPPEVLKSVA